MDLKRKSMGGCALDSCHEGYGPTDGSCEYATALLSSTACNKLFWLDQELIASHAVCYSSSHNVAPWHGIYSELQTSTNKKTLHLQCNNLPEWC